MIPQEPPSLTACSKGTRYSSRRVRSSTWVSMLLRSNSESLPTKCLAVVATPRDCTPRTKAAAIRPVRIGSSLNDSKLRPPLGERCKLIVGANNTCERFDRASSPNSSPNSSTRPGSHVAPRTAPLGMHAVRLPVPMSPSPRAPLGPSVTFSFGTPSRSTPRVCHMSPPVTMATFSSVVIAARSSSIRLLIAGNLHGRTSRLPVLLVFALLRC